MTVIFDGHDLSSLFDIGDPDISILNSKADFANSDSMTGAMVLGRRWDVSSVSFAIVAHGTASARRNAFSTLGSWLNVDAPKKLVLPDTPDRYYMAIPDGSLDLERGILGEKTRIAFKLADPVAYSAQETTVTVPSGGTLTFDVGGTFPAKPRIQATAVRNSSSLVWGVRLDEGDFVHVATGNSAGRVVVVDCDARTVTLSGNAHIMTLDSDWLELSPGSHTLRMDNGTGAATVKFRERWL